MPLTNFGAGPLVQTLSAVEDCLGVGGRGEGGDKDHEDQSDTKLPHL